MNTFHELLNVHSEPKKRGSPSTLWLILAPVLMLGGAAMIGSLYGDDPVASASAGVVQSVETAPPFEPRGFVSWASREPVEDRILVVTDKDRYMVSGVGGYTLNAPVEIRETMGGERQLCVVDRGPCGKLWNDQTPLAAVEAAPDPIPGGALKWMKLLAIFGTMLIAPIVIIGFVLNYVRTGR